MPLVFKFYFTSSCDFSIISPHRSCVLVSMCVGVSVWLGRGGIRVAVVLQPATRIPPLPNDQCGDTIEKSQAPDDGCINVRNMLSIEEVK